MDYVYKGMLIEAKTGQGNLNSRLLTYDKILQAFMPEKKQDPVYGKKQSIDPFWEKESKWEQKKYNKLKKWQRRHPIMGIAVCTILCGILVSLAAGIVLEVILLYL